MTVLVTGGAGYIGWHMVLGLLDAGENPFVIDNMSNGVPWAVPNGVPFDGGHFPSVAWITPNSTDSEHPSSSTADGMHYVTAIVNTIMQSPYWRSTVIFIGWDDWGGFY